MAMPAMPPVPNAGNRSPYYSFVEAESFDASQGALRQGTSVGGLGRGDWIAFRKMNFDVSLPKLLQVTSSGGSTGSGSINFRLDAPTGPIVSTVNVGNSGGWDKFVKRQASVNPAGIGGVHDLYVTVDASHQLDFVNLDKFIFQKPGVPTGFGAEPGETLILLGDTHDEFDGSIWAQVTGDHLGGVPPRVDLPREKLLAEVLTAASRDGLVSSAHDLSEGGLIQTVVEAALAGETGCRILLPEGFGEADAPFVFLFSESAGRVLVAVPRTEESRFIAMCEARGLPATRIGVVDQGSDAVEVQGQFSVPLTELRATWEATLPKLFG